MRQPLNNYLPNLRERIEAIRNETRSANLGNLDFIRQVNDLLDTLISFDHKSFTPTMFYWNPQFRISRNRVLQDLLTEIQEQAKEVKRLFRQAALETLIDPKSGCEFRSQINVILLSLSIALIEYSEIVNEWDNLPLFYLPNTTVELIK